MVNAYTTFPDSVQRFDLKTDVSSSVYADWKQFNTYIANGQFANASTLLQTNTELQKCIIDGNYMNSVSKTLEEVEDLFLNQIQTYIHETVIDKGVWSSTTKYTKYNFVTYSLNGIVQTYECLRDDTPIGIAPTNTTYWVPRVIRGEKGDPGMGLSPRGIYSETTVYFQYDLVLYGDQLWYTIKDNPSGAPSETNADWRSFFMFNGASIAYDNSASRLSAATVQGAIDEVVTNATITNNNLLDHVQTLNKGGTGATTAEQARTNLGLGVAATRAVDTIPTASSANLITSGGVKTVLDTKVNKSVSIPITFAAASWIGAAAPYSYTISNANITATNMIELVFPSGTTQAIVDAWNDASVGRYTQSAGSIILYANGTKPTVAIPMTMIVRGDV